MIAQIPTAMALPVEPAAPPRPDAPADGAGQAFDQAMQDDSAAPHHEGDRKTDDPAPRSAGVKPRRRGEKPAQDDPVPAAEPTGPASPQTASAPDPKAEAPVPPAGPKTEAAHDLAALSTGKDGRRAAAPALPMTPDSPLLEGDQATQPTAPAPAAPAVAPTPTVLSSVPEALRAAAQAPSPQTTPRTRDAHDVEAPSQASTDAPAMAVGLRTSAAPAPAAKPAWSQAASVLMWQAGDVAAQGPVDAPPPGAAAAARLVTESPEGQARSASPAQAIPYDGIQVDPAAAPAAPLAAPTIPVPSQPVLAQVEPVSLPRPFHPMVAAIAAQATHPAAAKPASAATELILHPAELGRIRFSLSGAGDQLTIAINAENRETLALLQRHIPALQAELQREGLGQANLAFSGWGGEGAARQDAPASAPPGFWSDATTDAPAVPPTDSRASPLPGGSLDLRL